MVGSVLSCRASVADARLKLRVTAAAERAIRSGHPWLFSESIQTQSRAGELGELAVIYDRNNRFLAAGLYDPESPLRVRLLVTGQPQTLDAAWWNQRFQTAVARRHNLFADNTTGYRWIHGENDGWPGLVLDRYADSLVMKLYTAIWFPRLEEIIALITRELAPAQLVLRLSRNIQNLAGKEYHLTDGQLLQGGKTGETVIFRENGIHLEAEIYRGQKTGFFLDQRENRQRVEQLAAGRAALNAFSFSGGFSLYAARGGAKSVTDVDISAHALASCRRNFALNQDNERIARCRHEVVQVDAFEYLETARPSFDLVVLDPPSLARRESERQTAIGAYQGLAASGIRCLRPRGILMAASCSAHVSNEEFFGAVRLAARNSGRKFAELQTTRHAPDHHATFAEAEYLKGIYLRFD